MVAEQPITGIMTTDVYAVLEHVSIPAIARIMVDQDISGLPVIDDEGHLVGIVTEADIVSHEMQTDTPTFIPFLDAIIRMPGDTSEDDIRRVLATTAGELMTSPVTSVTVDATVREVATLMFERRINPVPVLNHMHQVVGIVSRSDIVRLIAEANEQLAEPV